MSTTHYYPAVVGNLGENVANIKVLAMDQAQPTFTSGISDRLFYTSNTSIMLGDILLITWNDNKSDFGVVVSVTGGLGLHKFALAS